ncbi:UL16-binding protein 1-like [Acomys russatus]|uniref:UL16-binding protein 1-like n=1 Tax=Acomys russatus TaxID=60746 RepID=UPI0021E27D9F|nr:UL16-binding protein 1-like [Acomys russatus]
MAKTAAAEHNPSTLALRLLVPLSCLWSLLSAVSFTEAASLCYNFSVGKSGSGPWRYEVQGQLNEETFLRYSNNKCLVFSALGNRLNATKICEHQVDTLSDLVYSFKEQALHINQVNNTIREPLTLQPTMCCQYEGDGNGIFNGYWELSLNGSKMFHADANTGKWIEVDSRFSWIKDTWVKNRDLTASLNRIVQGDCRTWLDEFKLHWEEKLEPIALPTTIAEVDQLLSMAFLFNPSDLLILPCFLLHVF